MPNASDEGAACGAPSEAINMNNQPENIQTDGDRAVSSLAPCSAKNSVRTLRVLFWISFLGEYVERCVNVPSPPVSNQPDPSIQHAADCRVVDAWRNASGAPSGTAYCILGVLPNTTVSRDAGADGAPKPLNG